MGQFNTRKQHALNEVEVYTPLSTKQFHSLQNLGEDRYALPPTMEDMVIMDRDVFKKLQTRADGIYDERVQLKQEFNALRRENRRLQKEIKAAQIAEEAAKAKCESTQMLKFGQLIALETLDNL